MQGLLSKYFSYPELLALYLVSIVNQMRYILHTLSLQEAGFLFIIQLLEHWFH
jgi:hypothetical protein